MISQCQNACRRTGATQTVELKPVKVFDEVATARLERHRRRVEHDALRARRLEDAGVRRLAPQVQEVRAIAESVLHKHKHTHIQSNIAPRLRTRTRVNAKKKSYNQGGACMQAW